jgi:hypothetical protein
MQEREYELEFDGPYDGFTLSIYINEKHTVKFSRKDRRWRIVGWHYCKSHVVATALFDLIGDDNQWKVSEEEFEAAVDWADDLASILDKATYSFTEYVRTKEERAKQPRVDFFGLRADEIKPSTADPEDKSSLYLMRHTNGLTKIGKSVQPKARERTLQAEDPRLEMILCVEGQGYREKALHRIFDELRVRGEWFRLEDRHVDWISFLFFGIAST